MLICDLIKDQDTYEAELGHTVLETVCAMVERNIGAVPVIHNGKLVGIFSERDLMRRVVAEGRDPKSTCMAEVMTDDPMTISTSENLGNCMALMRRHDVRLVTLLPLYREGCDARRRLCRSRRKQWPRQNSFHGRPPEYSRSLRC